MKSKPLLLIGLAIIIVAVISYIAFPAWRSQPGGWAELLGAVTVGILAAAKDVVSILKDLRESKGDSKTETPKLADTIHQEGKTNIVAGSINANIIGDNDSQIEVGRNMPASIKPRQKPGKSTQVKKPK